MLLFLCVVTLFPPLPSRRILTDGTAAHTLSRQAAQNNDEAWSFLTSRNVSLLDYEALFSAIYSADYKLKHKYFLFSYFSMSRRTKNSQNKCFVYNIINK
jgi:hypothetical protein